MDKNQAGSYLPAKNLQFFHDFWHFIADQSENGKAPKSFTLTPPEMDRLPARVDTVLADFYPWATAKFRQSALPHQEHKELYSKQSILQQANLAKQPLRCGRMHSPNHILPDPKM